MNIYLLTQTHNNGYDTYDSCVVIAENEEQSKSIELAPCGCVEKHGNWCTWADSEYVRALLIGTGEGPARNILSSFNAG